jgi:hypothetical protein
LARLPQLFITNIKIDFNKTYLDRSIYEIYQENGVITSIEEFMEKGYIIEDKIDVFRNFLRLTFREVFESYVASKQYIKDYHHIKKREGEEFAILFNFISKILVQYYTKSKGNQLKEEGKKRVKIEKTESGKDKINLFEIRKVKKIETQ